MRMDKKIMFMITMIVLSLSFTVSADMLIFGVFEDLPPYEYTENGELKGIDIEIGREIFSRLGTEIRYEVLPWARMKTYAKEGEIDGILAMYCLETYLDILDFAESPIRAEISFFARKESTLNISGIDSLKGQSVGVIRGYTYTPEFASYTDITRDECDDDEMLVKKLAGGRFEVAVAEDIPFRFISKKLGFQDTFKKLYTLTEHRICMGFSKKALGAESRIWAERVTDMFQKLEEEGVIQQILDKYLQ